MNIITRAPSGMQGTFGIWTLDSMPLCLTCELPWLDNAPAKSSISSGTYHCVRHVSPKYPDGNTWEVTNVPGRSGILIHNGNDINDLLGCIAVGSSFGIVAGLPAVLNSRDTLAMLNARLGDEFDLNIR